MCPYLLSRKSELLLISDNSVSLPQRSQLPGQASKPVPQGPAAEPPTTSRGGAARPSSTPPTKQPKAVQKAGKPTHAHAADSNPGVKSNGQLTALATKAPRKMKKQKKTPANAAASGQAAAQVASLETAKEAQRSQPTDAANQQVPVNQSAGKKKKKRKTPEVASDQPAEPSLQAAPAAATTTAKRRKKIKESAAEQSAPPAEQAEAAAAEHTVKKKKKKGRNETAPDEAAQAAPGESAKNGQAPAAAEGRVGEANLPAVPETLGGADTVLSWRQDMKRKDVKHGRFSLSERETIKQAVKVSSPRSWL